MPSRPGREATRRGSYRGNLSARAGADPRDDATGRAATYSYDAANRLGWLSNDLDERTTYSYNAADQLTVAEEEGILTTSSYDANGNLFTQEEGSGRTTYTWDGENRATLLQLPTGTRNTMVYDGQGVRQRFEEAAGVHQFVWDGQNLLVEQDGGGAEQVAYTSAPRGYGHLISQRRSGASYFHHYTGLGSTARVTNAAGATVQDYGYDGGEFGEQLSPDPAVDAIGNRLTWVGELGYVLQADPRNYWLRARLYDPKTGRFLSRDPLLAASPNRYLYARNRPTMLVDPSGLVCTARTGSGCMGTTTSGCTGASSATGTTRGTSSSRSASGGASAGTAMRGGTSAASGAVGTPSAEKQGGKGSSGQQAAAAKSGGGDGGGAGRGGDVGGALGISTAGKKGSQISPASGGVAAKTAGTIAPPHPGPSAPQHPGHPTSPQPGPDGSPGPGPGPSPSLEPGPWAGISGTALGVFAWAAFWILATATPANPSGDVYEDCTKRHPEWPDCTGKPKHHLEAVMEKPRDFDNVNRRCWQIGRPAPHVLKSAPAKTGCRGAGGWVYYIMVHWQPIPPHRFPKIGADARRAQYTVRCCHCCDSRIPFRECENLHTSSGSENAHLTNPRRKLWLPCDDEPHWNGDEPAGEHEGPEPWE